MEVSADIRSWRGRVVLVGTLSLVPGTIDAQDYVPCTAPEWVDEHTELVRGGDRDIPQRLDLFLPSRDRRNGRTIMAIPDVGDEAGEEIRCLARVLAGRGFAVAIPDYRSPRAHLYPGGLDDLEHARRWLEANGPAYGIEGRLVGALGLGFGGYLASLHSSQSVGVEAVVTVDAVLDLEEAWVYGTGYPYLYHAFLGRPLRQAPDLWRTASPLRQFSRRTPAHLVLQTHAGSPAPPGQQAKIQRALETLNVPVRQYEFEIDLDLIGTESVHSELVERVASFFTQRLWVAEARVRWTLDRNYASPGGRDLFLDVFRPTDTEAATPAVLLFHGGGWVWGSKRNMRDEAAELAANGFVAVPVEYRLATEAVYPAAANDVKAAVRWVREHAGELGVAPEAIGVVGNSAGGHLAALLGVTPELDHFGDPSRAAESSSAVQAVGLISAVVDLPGLAQRDWYSPTVFIGTPYEQAPDLWEGLSPSRLVDEGAAPTIALHGTRDELGSLEEIEEMASRLRSFGISAEVVPIIDGEHDFWERSDHRSAAMKALIEFLSAALRIE